MKTFNLKNEIDVLSLTYSVSSNFCGIYMRNGVRATIILVGSLKGKEDFVLYWNIDKKTMSIQVPPVGPTLAHLCI